MELLWYDIGTLIPKEWNDKYESSNYQSHDESTSFKEPSNWKTSVYICPDGDTSTFNVVTFEHLFVRYFCLSVWLVIKVGQNT